MGTLETARQTRNDVCTHFWLGMVLFRRSSSLERDRLFYDVSSLVLARRQIEPACKLGNEILYANGGAFVRDWLQTG